IAASEKSTSRHKIHESPFVLLAQPSLFDNTRAPKGNHTAWAYCHVPHGSTIDMTEAIEQQITRFARDFKKMILAKHTMNTVDMPYENPYDNGFDINGVVQDTCHHFSMHILRLSFYTTLIPIIYLCLASTPPGVVVHGMFGFHAAKKALSDHFNIKAKL